MSVVDFPTKGRAVKSLPEHTFKDAGVTVRLRKLSPSTLQDMQRSVEKEWKASDDADKHEPQPPIIEADGIVEKNEADPTYQTEHVAWQVRVNAEVNRRLYVIAALYAVEMDIDHDQVAELRRMYQLTGVEVEEDERLTQDERDRVFYLTRILIATPEDRVEFTQAVTARIQPSEEDIKAHADSFSSDV